MGKCGEAQNVQEHRCIQEGDRSGEGGIPSHRNAPCDNSGLLKNSCYLLSIALNFLSL